MENYNSLEIYVINLEKRKDRLNKFTNIFSKLIINRIEAIEDLNGHIGCFKSHQKCISIAKEKKLPYIIVMEDDCEPIFGQDIFIEQVNNILVSINNLNNWNIFIGCGNKIRKKNIVGQINITNNIDYCNNIKLYWTNFCKSFHFVIYSNKIYDFFLNLDPYTSLPIDRVWHGNFNAIISIPFITTQSDDYSDIEKKNVSYNKSFISYQNKLIKELGSNN